MTGGESTDTSVAEALRRAHLALLEDLRRLEQAARPAPGEGAAALRARLEEVRPHVAEHFRFEEQNGYMDVVRSRAPHLDRAIGQLAEEHRLLAQSLDALIAEAGAVGEPGEALRAEVRAWVGRVRRHEAGENELIQDVFNLDLGAGD
ncbi:MAG TPA: hemerythrin domain-containing protein [Gemmataceae bacterium]